MLRKRLHIAFFNRSFYPDTAATGQLLTELCEELVHKYDCRVSVVAGVPLLPSDTPQAADQPGLLVRREAYRGIQILRARGTRFSKSRFIGRFCNYVSYFLSACLAGLRLDRPDVIVALTDPPIIGLAGYLAARRFGVPLVMSYRDIFPEVARLMEDFNSELINSVLQRVNIFLTGKAEFNIALGESMRRKLIDEKGATLDNTLIIRDWADCSAIVPQPKVNSFSRDHGIDQKFVVMHSGNIGLSQGLDLLVEAAGHLRHYPDIQVVFVGDGAKKADLQGLRDRLELNNVTFLPYQPKDLLKDSFSSADVFVVSLKPGLDGFIVPSKIYGILASGRPYVAAVESDGEVAAITNRFECGLLAKPGSAGDLASKILELYQNRDLTVRLGSNARRAAAQFDRPVQIQAYYDLFQSLVPERSQPVVPVLGDSSVSVVETAEKRVV